MKFLRLKNFTSLWENYAQSLLFRQGKQIVKDCISTFLLVLIVPCCYGQLASIRGNVKDQAGRAATQVSVSLSPGHLVSLTDQAGDFTIAAVEAGRYMISLRHVGLITESKHIEVKPGEILTLDFSLREDVQSLQEVTVTTAYNKFSKKETDGIAKMPLKNLDNPQVYNVVPKELLKDQVIVSYNDVLKNVTGVSQSLVNGSNSFNLRGFFTTSYLRNGLQQAIGNSIEVANIERIEVLKGPSATLFGNSMTSFGGLLNRVTKKPFETTRGEISYTLGGFGLSRITADINTPLNEEKGLFLRTNVAYHDEKSFQDAGFTKRFLFAPSLLYKVNDRLSLLVNAEIYLQKANDFNRLFPSASFIKTNPRDLNVNWKRSFSANDLYQKQPSVSLFGQANYKISDQWNSQTSFSHTNASTEGYWSWNSILGDTAVSRNPGYEHILSNYTEIQQNFNSNFRIGSLNNRLVFGLDYLTSSTNSTAASIYGFDVVGIRGNDAGYSQLTRASLEKALSLIPNDKSETKQSVYSAYISDVLNLTDKLLVMASLRVDHFSTGGTYNINLNSKSGDYNQTALSPKLGVVYQVLKDQVSVFGNYMNGFQNNAPSRQPDGSYSTFKPSQANQWETGVKLDLLNGKLNGTLSYYHIKVNNVIHNDFTPGREQFSVQDGGQLSKGFEAELIASPFAGFNMIAGYAYNDIYSINTNENADGLRQWTGPAQTANLWLSYHLLKGSFKGIGLGIGGNYNGKAYIQQSRAFGEFYIPSFTVLNTAISYEKAAYRISLKMDNLTNQVYWGSYVSQMMPRRFSAMLTIKF